MAIKMKKLLAAMLALIMVATFVLTGCSSNDLENQESNNGDGPLKIVLLVNGNLGDKSFFDSANEGLKQIKEKFEAETKVIEIGPDQMKWESALADISEESWDIIICGTWQMREYLEKIAPEHPEKKYILFDAAVDYEKGDFKNVYSINYKQNEGSFLAGALAAKVTSSDMALVNEEKIIGFVGGADTPVINDFLVGYIRGAQYVDSEVKVAISYIADFFDTAKGKEMALAQYNQKADIVFPVASQAGLGALDAAKSEQGYAIGVDSDQSMLFKDLDEEKANLILSSVLKRVDNSLVRAIELETQGKLQWGTAESLGLKEESVVLAKNELYDKNVPEDFKALIEELSQKIISGEIEVESALGMETETLNDIRNSVKP
ncbi:BMP family ABC transporter substrate-binding protein [Proteiniborus sp. MB09-C3]|uniref:BMP family ABC transporter substrate-binding protein n=1 Tax=Proteiniborus sp. MB09-C3 TaxID=3050072 RepID=UPI0025545FA2|nr:BMP family ABC transporter substrate-binding protein [Proteiniborus sp. MB09-C3]WIV13511.1 BMP family ABC transporter substrate-binding protein [Proteiniborus sp. MB09-C3]